VANRNVRDGPFVLRYADLPSGSFCDLRIKRHAGGPSGVFEKRLIGIVREASFDASDILPVGCENN
jgi:hypothetical protein